MTTASVAKAYPISSEEFYDMSGSSGGGTADYQIKYNKLEKYFDTVQITNNEGLVLTQEVHWSFWDPELVVHDSDGNGAPELYLRVPHLLGAKYWAFDLTEQERTAQPSDAWKNMTSMTIPYDINPFLDVCGQEAEEDIEMVVDAAVPAVLISDAGFFDRGDLFLYGSHAFSAIRHFGGDRQTTRPDAGDQEQFSRIMSCAWNSRFQEPEQADAVVKTQIRSFVWAMRGLVEPDAWSFW